MQRLFANLDLLQIFTHITKHTITAAGEIEKFIARRELRTEFFGEYS